MKVLAFEVFRFVQPLVSLGFIMTRVLLVGWYLGHNTLQVYRSLLMVILQETTFIILP